MIVSTTLTNSRADVIGAALATIAPEVDACIVIDTGATDDTMQIARAVLGPKFVGVAWPWRNDFAAARNFALDYGRDWLRMRPDAPLGGRGDDPRDWVVTADTDEWQRLPGLRAWLANVPAEANVVMVPHHSRTYRQSRIFRATCEGRWNMPVHEYFSGFQSVEAPPDWTFQCQPRPNEDIVAKYEHYRRVLEGLVAAEPTNQRALYYLGDTLAILGYKGSAISMFNRCGEAPGWNEQSAWARYRQAILLAELGLRTAAFEACIKGLARAPNVTELYWLAGWIAYQDGAWSVAKTYAEAALKVPPQTRAGFCYPPAQRELPEQLLRFAQAQLDGAPLEQRPPA